MQDSRCPNNTLPAYHSSKQPCGDPSPSTQPERLKDRQGTQRGKGWAVPGELPAQAAVQSLKQVTGAPLRWSGVTSSAGCRGSAPRDCTGLTYVMWGGKTVGKYRDKGIHKDQSPVNRADFKRHHNAF